MKNVSIALLMFFCLVSAATRAEEISQEEKALKDELKQALIGKWANTERAETFIFTADTFATKLGDLKRPAVAYTCSFKFQKGKGDSLWVFLKGTGAKRYLLEFNKDRTAFNCDYSYIDFNGTQWKKLGRFEKLAE